ncbi:1-deoxy-D-xylulose-5-phosphate reductoisomerase [Paramagnetospirillum kuznetsovii]|uniref:1-deoxy-D-xylulose 5-phosphate reductoisomerase n=1 Tax=Paramagnetospirillum kuznetsovii TaxID=2053833 RepID=A0A364P075_9PROT|nr:1-deoxy-D-xylulose-5-phosphate reductoisomerase [Paramagnetospirillum kuznetsovii]RAU22567.1 1-deoxy-D-xylulose-5-phosphate reductoisomerase [Paramagnetospirillum kuznetsovii]
MSARRGVTILGSTGSIGCNTVELIEARPDLYRVEALVANSRVDILADQARRLKAKLAVVADEAAYPALKEALAGSGIEAAAGARSVVAAAELPADWVMAAIVGAAGLAPTLAAVRRGAVVGLANKECLVCAGQLMMAEVQKHKATLLPVDSEHSAIFQVFEFDQHDKIEKIILTASGGPFRTKSREFMADVTPEQAVAHPNWSMGAKISVDSASMFNKGLELIEAHHLFDMPEDKIDIVVHPQSVIHSLVAYVDGSVLAQLGSPDMRTPIAYALGWPNRIEAPAPKLDLAAIATLTFEQPDPVRFPSLRLARESLRAGGSAAAVMNAANEVAVAAFLGRKIGFLDIARVVEKTLERVPHEEINSIDDVLAKDAEARAFASGLIEDKA